jgi:hypothetical protein
MAAMGKRLEAIQMLMLKRNNAEASSNLITRIWMGGWVRRKAECRVGLYLASSPIIVRGI